MAETVFIISAIMSVVCAVALFRGYRKSMNRMLLWSCLCFVFMAATNIFLCLDLIVFPGVDMSGTLVRSFLTAIAGGLLLFGLIWEIA